jgi:hypothetical protein
MVNIVFVVAQIVFVLVAVRVVLVLVVVRVVLVVQVQHWLNNHATINKDYIEEFKYYFIISKLRINTFAELSV